MADWKREPDEDGYWDEIYITSDVIGGWRVIELHTNGDLSSHSEYILKFEDVAEIESKGFVPQYFVYGQTG